MSRTEQQNGSTRSQRRAAQSPPIAKSPSSIIILNVCAIMMSSVPRQKPVNPFKCSVLATCSTQYARTSGWSVQSPNSCSTPLLPPFSLQSAVEDLEGSRVAMSHSHSEPSFAGRAIQLYDANCPPLISSSKNRGVHTPEKTVERQETTHADKSTTASACTHCPKQTNTTTENNTQHHKTTHNTQHTTTNNNQQHTTTKQQQQHTNNQQQHTTNNNTLPPTTHNQQHHTTTQHTTNQQNRPTKQPSQATKQPRTHTKHTNQPTNHTTSQPKRFECGTRNQDFVRPRVPRAHRLTRITMFHTNTECSRLCKAQRKLNSTQHKCSTNSHQPDHGTVNQPTNQSRVIPTIVLNSFDWLLVRQPKEFGERVHATRKGFCRVLLWDACDEYSNSALVNGFHTGAKPSCGDCNDREKESFHFSTLICTASASAKIIPQQALRTLVFFCLLRTIIIQSFLPFCSHCFCSWLLTFPTFFVF